MTTIRPEDGGAIELVLKLIDDPEPAVRRTVIKFLAVVPDSVLAAARVHEGDADADVARGLRLVVDAVLEQDPEAIAAGLADHEGRVRRYAVAAAARLASRDGRLLAQAIQSDDPDVSKFAAARARSKIDRPQRSN
jgi:hypothetical protein